MTGADNQQERLRFAGWLTGFVDGEGCFSIGLNSNTTMTTGWQVQPTFTVVQGASSVDALLAIQGFLGCGKVYVNNRRDNHREPLYRYTVLRIGDLSDVIIPFFRENRLRTSKVVNFEKFAHVVSMMRERRHLDLQGLIEIAWIASTMNHRSDRALRRILRDCTPAISAS